jgi:hypothetical protein
MKVKFTNPARFSQDDNGQPILNPFFDPALDGPVVLFGRLIRANVSAGTVVVEYSLSAMRYELELDPASDFNFKFIQNDESDLKFDLALGQHAEELERLNKQAQRSK